MTEPMFDLEDCEDAVLIDNETTSKQLIKAKRCPRPRFENNRAGVNELGKLGLPIEDLNEEQINIIIKEIIQREGRFSIKDNDWLTNAATFTTLAADVQSTVIGGLAATGISCYQALKTKILK
ncbi:hypothetical protein LMH77_24375 [Vibrio lentus]|uniref:hypothetical protein n=1 Tax=Vibrio lentus TaxID=136468 RepID=UPI001E3C25D5|nr:hypothetical protein [Vibrio lentus]MCC4786047.1 hypothetical protein [Vibrio lentus]